MTYNLCLLVGQRRGNRDIATYLHLKWGFWDPGRANNPALDKSLRTQFQEYHLKLGLCPAKKAGLQEGIGIGHLESEGRWAPGIEMMAVHLS